MFWEIFGNHAGSESLIKVQQEVNAGHISEADTSELVVNTGKVISQEMVNGKLAAKSGDEHSALDGMPEGAMKVFQSLF